MTITIEEVVQIIIISDLYWDPDEHANVMSKISINQFNNHLETAFYTLKAFPSSTCDATIKTVREIMDILNNNYAEVEKGLTKYINLNKLREIL